MNYHLTVILNNCDLKYRLVDNYWTYLIVRYNKQIKILDLIKYNVQYVQTISASSFVYLLLYIWVVNCSLVMWNGLRQQTNFYRTIYCAMFQGAGITWDAGRCTHKLLQPTTTPHQAIKLLIICMHNLCIIVNQFKTYNLLYIFISYTS